MSFFQEDGVLTSRTSTGTDVITLTGTGASLDVKLVRVIMNGATATGGADADFMFSQGWSDGTNERCVGSLSEDNVSTSVCKRWHHDNGVIAIYDTSGTLIDLGLISAIGVGTFTINWTTKSGNAYKIGYTTYGGSDITAVEIGADVSPTSVTTQNVTTTIKSADMAFVGSAATTSGQVNTVVDWGNLALGSCDASVNQGVTSVAARGGMTTSETYRYQGTDAAIATISASSGSLIEEADITALDAVNGIQLNWSSAISSQFQFFYVLIKGGRWEVGSGTNATSATTKAFTTAFQPLGLSLFHVGNTASASVNTNNRMTFGSTDGSSQFGVWVGDGDNLGDTQTGTIFRDDYTWISAFHTTTNPTTQGLASFSSFNANDFTLDWSDDADNVAREFIWVVCAGNESTGPNSLALLGVG